MKVNEIDQSVEGVIHLCIHHGSVFVLKMNKKGSNFQTQYWKNYKFTQFSDRVHILKNFVKSCWKTMLKSVENRNMLERCWNSKNLFSLLFKHYIGTSWKCIDFENTPWNIVLKCGVFSEIFTQFPRVHIENFEIMLESVENRKVLKRF